MSTSNQISIEIPQEVLAGVMQKLTECKTALAPYLQALTTDNRKSLFKMGDKTVATVQKVKSYLEHQSRVYPFVFQYGGVSKR